MKPLLLLLVLVLASCGESRLPVPVAGPVSPTPTQVPAAAQSELEAAHKAQADATAAQREAERKALAAAKTSQEARAVAAARTQELDAAEAQVKSLKAAVEEAKAKAEALSEQEAVERIQFWAWIAIAAGTLAGAAGVALTWYLGRSFLGLSAAGGAVVALGLCGLFIAPHWVLVVRTGAALVALGVLIEVVRGVRKLVLTARLAAEHGDNLETAVLGAVPPGSVVVDDIKTAIAAVKSVSSARQASAGIWSLLDKLRS